MALLALAQLLAGTNSGAQRAADELLDALEPYVTHGDRETRRVLLDGEPLDAVLERMFCA